MKKALIGVFFVMASQLAYAQVANDADGLYDSTTLVDTNNNSTSTSTVNSTSTNTNTNNNVNTTTVDSNSTNTNNNNNVNTSTSTSTNTNYNVNSGTMTNNNNNVNTNSSTSTSTSTNANTNTNVNTGDMTNRNINDSKIEQTVKSPPPSAIAPAMMSGGNNDLCTVGSSGAVQTQILGVSSGGVVRDKNCERLKNAKTLYDMGMKVAAVSTLCQDRRVFDAMWNAGTPCPYEGEIGGKARVLWEKYPEKKPAYEEEEVDSFYKKTTFGAVLGYLLFLAL